jgi:hypothetical protein
VTDLFHPSLSLPKDAPLYEYVINARQGGQANDTAHMFQFIVHASLDVYVRVFCSVLPFLCFDMPKSFLPFVSRAHPLQNRRDSVDEQQHVRGTPSSHPQ